MNTTHRSAILCAVFFLPGMALRAQAPSILEPKVERLQGPPLWVSAQALADAERIINLDLLDKPSLRGYVERQRRELEDRTPAAKSTPNAKPAITSIPISECKVSQASSDHGHRGGRGSRSTLLDLATNSRSIVRGAIRSITWGFDGGVPGSLLSVEVSATIKGPAPVSPFYVLYPIARFRIGPLYFCNALKGFEPRPGDQILLFDYTGPVDREDILFAPHLDQIVFAGQGGELFLPEPLARQPETSPLTTLEDVIARLSPASSFSSRPKGGWR